MQMFEFQTELTVHMREILIDWLIDVNVHFGVADETLHSAVGYLDRYLRVEKV